MLQGKRSRRTPSAEKTAYEATLDHFRRLLDRLDAFPDLPLDRSELTLLDKLKAQGSLVPYEAKHLDFVDLIIVSIFTYRSQATEDKEQLVKDNCTLLLTILDDPFLDFAAVAALLRRLVEFSTSDAENIFCNAVCAFLVRTLNKAAIDKLEWALELMWHLLEDEKASYFHAVLEHFAKKKLPELLTKLYDEHKNQSRIRTLIRSLASPLGLPTLQDDLPELQVRVAIATMDTILDEVIFKGRGLEEGAAAIANVIMEHQNNEGYFLMEATASLLFYIYIVDHENLILRILYHIQRLCPFKLWEDSFLQRLVSLLDAPLLRFFCQVASSTDQSEAAHLMGEGFLLIAKGVSSCIMSFPDNFTGEILDLILCLPYRQAKKVLLVVLLYLDQNMPLLSTEALKIYLEKLLQLSIKSTELGFAVHTFFSLVSQISANKSIWIDVLVGLREQVDHSRLDPLIKLIN